MTRRFARIVIAVCLLATLAPGQYIGLSTEIVDIGRDVGNGRIVGTMRLYAHMADPIDKLFLWGGNGAQVLQIQTTDPAGFYQHPAGGNLLAASCLADEIFPLRRYDSWLTIGGSPPQTIGIDYTAFNNGGGLSSNNGGVFNIPTNHAVCSVNGRILLAQFTVSVGETISGSMWLAGTLSNGNPPCGNVPNGQQWTAYDSFSLTMTAPPTADSLSASTSTISAAAGGLYTMTADFGDDILQNGGCYAGDFYVILGSVTGTNPASPLGFSVGGDLMLLPLVFDFYTNLTTVCPSPSLPGFCGFLSAASTGTATLAFPPNLPSTAIGAKVWHSLVVIDFNHGKVTHASSPIELTITP